MPTQRRLPLPPRYWAATTRRPVTETTDALVVQVMLAPVVQMAPHVAPPSVDTRTVPVGGTAGEMVKVTDESC